MGIAIRKDAAQSSLRKLVDSYAKQGRVHLKMICPVSNCTVEYLIYHDSGITEDDIRCGFELYLKRDHPNHPVMYEIDERLPQPSPPTRPPVSDN